MYGTYHMSCLCDGRAICVHVHEDSAAYHFAQRLTTLMIGHWHITTSILMFIHVIFLQSHISPRKLKNTVTGPHIFSVALHNGHQARWVFFLFFFVLSGSFCFWFFCLPSYHRNIKFINWINRNFFFKWSLSGGSQGNIVILFTQFLHALHIYH